MKIGAAHKLWIMANSSCNLLTSFDIKVTMRPVDSDCSPFGDSRNTLRYSAHIKLLRTDMPIF